MSWICDTVGARHGWTWTGREKKRDRVDRSPVCLSLARWFYVRLPGLSCSSVGHWGVGVGSSVGLSVFFFFFPNLFYFPGFLFSPPYSEHIPPKASGSEPFLTHPFPSTLIPNYPYPHRYTLAYGTQPHHPFPPDPGRSEDPAKDSALSQIEPVHTYIHTHLHKHTHTHTHTHTIHGGCTACATPTPENRPLARFSLSLPALDYSTVIIHCDSLSPRLCNVM